MKRIYQSFLDELDPTKTYFTVSDSYFGIERKTAVLIAKHSFHFFLVNPAAPIKKFENIFVDLILRICNVILS